MADVKQPILLISQVQRCGGSLLSHLFDGHTSCWSYPGELILGDDKYSFPDLSSNKSMNKIWDKIHNKKLSGFVKKGYRKQSNRATEKHKGIPFKYDEILHKRFFESVRKKGDRQILNKYLSGLFSSWSNYRNSTCYKSYVVAFIPRFSFREDNMDWFFSTYPDGHLISIVRDPVTWWCSIKRHKPQYEDKTKAKSLWDLNISSIQRNQDSYRDKMFVLKFEHLLTNTENVMVSLCKRLGLKFEDQLLKPTHNSIDIKADSSFQVPHGGIIQTPLHIKCLEEEAAWIRDNFVQFQGDYDVVPTE